MIKRQIIGAIGSIFLIIGVFAPMIKITLIGTMSFFDNSKAWGIVIVILAALSIALIIMKRPKLLWIPGIASLAIMGYTAWEAQKPMSSFKSKASRILGENLTDKVTDKVANKAMNYVHIQWGLVFLILGIIMIIVAAAYVPRNRQISEIHDE